MFLNYYYLNVLLRFCIILYLYSVILNFLFFLGSIIIDINIAYTIVWIFIFPIHLKSLVMHMCKKEVFGHCTHITLYVGPTIILYVNMMSLQCPTFC